MERRERTRESRQPWFSLSQETITILTIGMAIIGILLAHMAEIRADRSRLEASMNQMRAEGLAERREMRAEGRANREAFERKIARLVEQQGTLNGLVEGLRNPLPATEE